MTNLLGAITSLEKLVPAFGLLLSYVNVKIDNRMADHVACSIGISYQAKPHIGVVGLRYVDLCNLACPGSLSARIAFGRRLRSNPLPPRLYEDKARHDRALGLWACVGL